MRTRMLLGLTIIVALGASVFLAGGTGWSRGESGVSPSGAQSRHQQSACPLPSSPSCQANPSLSAILPAIAPGPLVKPADPLEAWRAGLGPYPSGHCDILTDKELLRAIRDGAQSEDRADLLNEVCNRIWEMWSPSRSGLSQDYCVVHPWKPEEARQLAAAVIPVLKSHLDSLGLPMSARLEAAHYLGWLGEPSGRELALTVLANPLDRATVNASRKSWDHEDRRNDPIRMDLENRQEALAVLSWVEPRGYFENLLKVETVKELQQATQVCIERIDGEITGRPWLKARAPWLWKGAKCTCSDRDGSK